MHAHFSKCQRFLIEIKINLPPPPNQYCLYTHLIFTFKISIKVQISWFKAFILQITQNFPPKLSLIVPNNKVLLESLDLIFTARASLAYSCLVALNHLALYCKLSRHCLRINQPVLPFKAYIIRHLYETVQGDAENREKVLMLFIGMEAIMQISP